LDADAGHRGVEGDASVEEEDEDWEEDNVVPAPRRQWRASRAILDRLTIILNYIYQVVHGDDDNVPPPVEMYCHGCKEKYKSYDFSLAVQNGDYGRRGKPYCLRCQYVVRGRLSLLRPGTEGICEELREFFGSKLAPVAAHQGITQVKTPVRVRPPDKYKYLKTGSAAYAPSFNPPPEDEAEAAAAVEVETAAQGEAMDMKEHLRRLNFCPAKRTIASAAKPNPAL
jgi:hypothetical protein